MMPIFRNPYVHVMRSSIGARAFNALTLELFEIDDAEETALLTDPTSLEPHSVKHLLSAGLLRSTIPSDHEAIDQHNQARSRIAETRTGVFTSMRISLTERCNLACDYCFQRKLFSIQQPEMTLDTLRKSIEWLIRQAEGESVSVQYFGGEPLLKWNLINDADSILTAARSDGLIPSFRQTITTNGTLLSTERAQWLVAHNFDVAVSIDGPPEVHDSHRITKQGRGTYANSIRGLRNFASAGGNCAVLLTATPDNVSSLADYVRYLVEESGLPITTIGLNSPQPTTSGWETGGSELAHSVYAMWKYCTEQGLNFHGPGTYIPQHLLTRQPQMEGCIDLTQGHGTKAGWPVYVSADGRRSLCLVHHNDDRVYVETDECISTQSQPQPSVGRETPGRAPQGEPSPGRSGPWHHRTNVMVECDTCIAVSLCGGPCSVERLLWDGRLNQDRCGFIQTLSSLILTHV